MANNITLNAGTGGSTLATEQNGSAEQYQKIKIVDGTAGAFTNMAAVTANGLAVDVKALVALPAGTNVIGHVIADSGSTTAVTGNVTAVQGTGSNLHTVIDNGTGTSSVPAQGAAASGATKSGNPVQVGGVFNTTQPTVTSGQAVEGQATARGAAIVATGVDTFNVTVNAALPAGSNTIGALTANQSVNVAQVAGTTTSTGNGATDAGTQRVTLANDSTGLVKLAAGANVVGHVIVDTTSTTAVTQATAANLLASVGGLAAAGASVSGNPLQAGGRAATANPTAVTNGQAAPIMVDKLGRQVVTLGHLRDMITDGQATYTNTTEATVIAAAGAGVFLDLTAVTIANTSATAVQVDLRDATAGTVRLTFEVPANATVGQTFTRPFKQATANNPWTAKLGGSVSSVIVTLQAEQNL